jgi:hypothetical protein
MKKLLILFFVSLLMMESQATVFPGKTINPVPGRKEAFLALEQFFKSYDTAILRRLKRPVAVLEDETAARSGSSDLVYMQQKNTQLISLLSAINPQVYNPALMNPADEMVVFAGALELYKEMNIQGKQGTGRMKVPWECIKDVIVGAFNIASIIIEFQALVESSASWSTIRPFLWRNLRRYGGWLMVAGVIWDIATDCFKL